MNNQLLIMQVKGYAFPSKVKPFASKVYEYEQKHFLQISQVKAYPFLYEYGPMGRIHKSEANPSE